MITSSFVFGITVVHNAAGYIASRLLIGIALAGFVTCQFWASMLFSPNVVGIANAIAGGWGNAGGSYFDSIPLQPCSVCPDFKRHCSSLQTGFFKSHTQFDFGAETMKYSVCSAAC